jgi:diguanylate cyclase (GGDEF)-like protein
MRLPGRARLEDKEHMDPALEGRLKRLVNFPSPAGVAAHIVNLASDPDIELGKVAQAVSLDPALAAKVLRIANSPFYAQRRKTENLRQALLVLGLNATITLALSFSLVKDLKDSPTHGVDYPSFWRRTLLAATVAQATGQILRLRHIEELFLAALLQDIGILALDRSDPEFYSGLDAHSRHADFGPYEIERIEMDHALVGGWLLRRWNIPDLLADAVELSHHPEKAPPSTPDGKFKRAVALSTDIAELFMNPEDKARFDEVAKHARQVLGIDRNTLGSIMEKAGSMIPDTESLFDMQLLGPQDNEQIMDQAREILMVRNLQTLHEVHHLKQAASSLASRTEELEEASRRDGLTGVFNRAYLDQVLEEEFANAVRFDWPLSIAFADLDRFKSINDTYGHQAGDTILKATAQILLDSTRKDDIVARYGGEEFILVLPATEGSDAQSVCDRIVTAFRKAEHDIGDQLIKVTISIGFASVGGGAQFTRVEDLVNAADKALYAAKQNGRDQAVGHTPKPTAKVVRI